MPSVMPTLAADIQTENSDSILTVVLRLCSFTAALSLAPKFHTV
jgi:hypothetical protein